MTKILNILVDTNEKQPLLFQGYDEIKIQKDSLEAGDYTLVGWDCYWDDFSVIIERKKDCQELVGNLGAKWEQFENEAKLLAKYKTRAIVVCGPDNFNYLYSRGFTKMNPNFIYKRLAYLHTKYGLSTYFFPNRDTAENFIFRLFIETIHCTDEQE